MLRAEEQSSLLGARAAPQSFWCGLLGFVSFFPLQVWLLSVACFTSTHATSTSQGIRSLPREGNGDLLGTDIELPWGFGYGDIKPEVCGLAHFLRLQLFLTLFRPPFERSPKIRAAKHSLPLDWEVQSGLEEGNQ